MANREFDPISKEFVNIAGYFADRDFRNNNGHQDDELEARKLHILESIRSLGNCAIIGSAHKSKADLYAAPEGHHLELLSPDREEMIVHWQDGTASSFDRGKRSVLWAVHQPMPVGTDPIFMDAETGKLGLIRANRTQLYYVFPDDQQDRLVKLERDLHTAFNRNGQPVQGPVPMDGLYSILPDQKL